MNAWKGIHCDTWVTYFADEVLLWVEIGFDILFYTFSMSMYGTFWHHDVRKYR